jgi:hypothetical protein
LPVDAVLLRSYFSENPKSLIYAHHRGASKQGSEALPPESKR